MERPCANMSDPCEWLCYYELPISLPYGEPIMNVSIRFERFCCLRQQLRERIVAVTNDPLRDEIELRRLFSAFFMQHSMMDPPRTFLQCAHTVVGASWLYRQYRVSLSPRLLAAIRGLEMALVRWATMSLYAVGVPTLAGCEDAPIFGEPRHANSQCRRCWQRSVSAGLRDAWIVVYRALD